MKENVLITGASSGLGTEFAEIYAKKGCNLVVVARSKEKLEALKERLEKQYGISVYVYAQDLSVQDAAAKVFSFTQENHIDVDVLVNDAGFADFGNFAEFDQTKQNALMQVNMIALVQLTRLYLPPMLSRHHGKVLNVASMASFFAGPKMSLYYASKAFVRSFTEAVAEETLGTGVTLTALCPGPVSTNFEKAASMESSNMFKFIKPYTARRVAECGVKACEKGKVLCYCGGFVKFASFASRFVSRRFARRCTAKVNG